MNVPLISQLAELRKRCIWILLVWGFFFIVCVIYSRQLYLLLAEPLLRLQEGSLIAIEVASPVFVPLKLAAFVSFLAALPVFFHQLWGFIVPGLYRKEKLIAFPLLLSSLLLFYCGMLFVYFVVLPLTLNFFHRFSPQDIDLLTDINQYFNFVIRFLVVFGFIFELPIIIFFLVRGGIVNLDYLKKGRRYFIVGSFIIAMLLTPPDIFSQTLLAVPMCLLYECGLLVASWGRRGI